MKIRLLLSFVVAFAFAQAQTTLTTYSDFTATDVHGNSHTVSTYLADGKFVFIDFFFTTCPPCIASVPYVNNVYTKFGANTGDVIMIAVDNGNTEAEVLAYETSYGGLLPSISGDAGGTGICSTYGIGAYPTFILIHPNGSIVEQDIWPASEAILTTVFEGHGITQQSAGVNELSLNDVTIFPNPAVDFLHIETEANVNAIAVYDMLGRKVVHASKDSSEMERIDLRQLPKGSYVLELDMESGMNRIVFQKN